MTASTQYAGTIRSDRRQRCRRMPGRGAPVALAWANGRKRTNPDNTKKKWTQTSSRENHGPHVGSPTAPVANVTWDTSTPVAPKPRRESSAVMRLDRRSVGVGSDMALSGGRFRVYLVVTFRRY